MQHLVTLNFKTWLTFSSLAVVIGTDWDPDLIEFPDFLLDRRDFLGFSFSGERDLCTHRHFVTGCAQVMNGGLDGPAFSVFDCLFV